MNREYSWREIWEDPENLNDAELSRAEEYWRDRVRGTSGAWAWEDKLNCIVAEREKRERARAPLYAAQEIHFALEDFLDEINRRLKRR